MSGQLSMAHQISYHYQVQLCEFDLSGCMQAAVEGKPDQRLPALEDHGKLEAQCGQDELARGEPGAKEQHVGHG